MEPFELLPRRERRRIDDAIQEQHAVEVIAFVLDVPASAPAGSHRGDTVAIEISNPNVDVTHHRAAQFGTDRHPSLSRPIVVDRLDDRINHEVNGIRGL